MYACICRAVTEGQIREAISSGCNTERQLRNRLGVVDSCGKCATQVRDMLGENSATKGASKPEVAELESIGLQL